MVNNEQYCERTRNAFSQAVYYWTFVSTLRIVRLDDKDCDWQSANTLQSAHWRTSKRDALQPARCSEMSNVYSRCAITTSVMELGLWLGRAWNWDAHSSIDRISYTPVATVGRRWIRAGPGTRLPATDAASSRAK